MIDISARENAFYTPGYKLTNPRLKDTCPGISQRIVVDFTISPVSTLVEMGGSSVGIMYPLPRFYGSTGSWE